MEEAEELLRGFIDPYQPGLSVTIYFTDGRWCVQQLQSGLSEVWPTDIHGEGGTLLEALRDTRNRVIDRHNI